METFPFHSWEFSLMDKKMGQNQNKPILGEQPKPNCLKKKHMGDLLNFQEKQGLFSKQTRNFEGKIRV